MSGDFHQEFIGFNMNLKKRDLRPFPTDSVLTRLLHTRPVSEDVPYDELSMKDDMIR